MIAKKYEKIICAMAAKRFPEETEMILKEADRQYDRFRKITPDIGGKENMQFKDLDFVIAFFSYYEACGCRIGILELEEFAYETMVKPAETVGKLIGWNDPLMTKIATKMYARYKKKTDMHAARGEWGNTWRVEMNPEGHAEGFAIHTRNCPIVDFCKTNGYEKFLPVICDQDYRIASAMHGILIRTHTVAQDSDYCDWWYFGDRQTLPEEAKNRQKEKQ